MNRKLRTTLPRLFRKTLTDGEEKALNAKGNIVKIKTRYDEHARNLKPLDKGQTVRYNHNGSWSRHGVLLNEPHLRLNTNDESSKYK